MARDYEQIRYELQDAVLTITLDRPDRRKAFTGRMCEELVDAFDRSDADDDVRAVVLTGAGWAFCAGADLGAGGATFAYPAGAAHRDRGGIVSMRIYESLKPVIAAFNGPVVGIGVTMTLPAEFRLASIESRGERPVTWNIGWQSYTQSWSESQLRGMHPMVALVWAQEITTPLGMPVVPDV